MTIRIALIGGGYWGEKLLRVFGALDAAEVCMIADADPSVRESLGNTVRMVSDPALAWGSPDIDAVAVVTPPSSHYSLAREVLSAGKHCWVEKPLAMQAGHAAELVGLAAQKGRTLFVDHTFLYDPLVQQAREWIDSGRLGRVYHLSFERLGMGRVRRDSDIWWNSAPHDLSILHHLVPAQVEGVRVDRFSYLQPGIADMCVGTVRLAGGISAHIYLSWLSPVKAASVVVVGDRGMLRYEGRFGQRALSFFDYAIADPQGVSSNVVPIQNFRTVETIEGGKEEPLRLAAEAFLESVRTGQPSPSDGRFSLEVVRLLAAA